MGLLPVSVSSPVAVSTLLPVKFLQWRQAKTVSVSGKCMVNNWQNLVIKRLGWSV